MTQAIEELEKLVEDLLHRIENGHTQSIGAIHNVRMVQYGVEEVPRYRECLHAILPRLRAEVRERPVGAGRTEAEVRERERAAARAAWLEGGRRWSECSWNCNDAKKEADQYVAETFPC